MPTLPEEYRPELMIGHDPDDAFHVGRDVDLHGLGLLGLVRSRRTVHGQQDRRQSEGQGHSVHSATSVADLEQALARGERTTRKGDDTGE